MKNTKQTFEAAKQEEPTPQDREELINRLTLAILNSTNEDVCDYDSLYQIIKKNL